MNIVCEWNIEYKVGNRVRFDVEDNVGNGVWLNTEDKVGSRVQLNIEDEVGNSKAEYWRQSGQQNKVEY